MAYENEDMMEDGEEASQEVAVEESRLPLEVIAGEGIDLAMVLPEDVLQKISTQCRENYDRDKSEREQWEGDYDAIAGLVRGDRVPKTFPWPNSSNVKYPLITTATLQFGARAYPAIVKGQDVVKVRVNGADPDGAKKARGNRIKQHMNWQLLEDMPEWEEETDKLVHMLPWAGCVFRQVIWDKTYARPKTSLISARYLVVSQSAKDLETVPLFTKEFELFPHEIIERQRTKQYLDTPIQFESDDGGKQSAQEMLEYHCRYDLDDDGYDEPYIAIVHKESGKVLSLKAGFWPKGVERGEPDEEYPNGRVLRVRRHVEFIKYDFLPDFQGGFLGIGFGYLLREHNEVINTLLNQLMDAGTDEIAGGGFLGRGVNLKGGTMEFAPGEWKYVNVPGQDLRAGIVPRPTASPSPVLFQLLGIMIEAGKDLSNQKDVLTGENQNAQQPATTTLAIVEQGMVVFNSIYKRIWRSEGKELKLIYQLNSAYLPDQAYFRVMDDEQAIARQDYAAGDHDVMPVADPSVTTSAQRLARAQFGLTLVGAPGVNDEALVKRAFEAAEFDNIEEIMPPPQMGPDGQPIPPPPPPEVRQAQMKMEMEQQANQARMQMDQQKAMADHQLEQAKAQAAMQMEKERSVMQAQMQAEKVRMDQQAAREKAALEAELARAKAGAELQLAREKMANEMQLARERLAMEAELNAFRAQNEAALSVNRPGGDLSK